MRVAAGGTFCNGLHDADNPEHPEFGGRVVVAITKRREYPSSL
jgi:hypothetical protein